MDNLFFPTSPLFRKYEFFWNSTSAWQDWQVWRKPMGKSMLRILCIGWWGWWGSWVIGANSTAAGGGWGGASGITNVTIPLNLIPNILYISVAAAKTGAWVASYVSIHPSTTANHVIAIANGWGAWGNASGATAGAAWWAGAVATSSVMPLGWSFATAIVGQSGIIWWTTGAAGALTLSVNWNLTSWGTWGAGLGAAGVAWTKGGVITAIAAPSEFYWNPAWVGGSAWTTPPTNWLDWYEMKPQGFMYFVWWTWWGSTHWTATGAWLVQASGWNGAIWCGGGGMWGALTGSTPWALSYGWPWYVQFIVF